MSKLFTGLFEQISSADGDLGEISFCRLLLEAFSGYQLSDYELAALASALKLRGLSARFLFAFTEELRCLLPKVELQSTEPILDCCGTGGAASFNISTSAAFLAASVGVKLVKHGGRANLSAAGSVDFLEALGVQACAEPQEIKDRFQSFGLVFISSPATQRVLGRLKAICKRIELVGLVGQIGVLSSPVKLDAQLIGVSQLTQGPVLREVLALQGLKKALVIHGEPKLDEFSLCGANHLFELNAGISSDRKLTPEDLGLKRFARHELEGGNATQNAEEFLAILSGGGREALRETILANAAWLLFLAKPDLGFRAGYELLAESLKTGQAKKFFEAYRSVKLL